MIYLFFNPLDDRGLIVITPPCATVFPYTVDIAKKLGAQNAPLWHTHSALCKLCVMYDNNYCSAGEER